MGSQRRDQAAQDQTSELLTQLGPEASSPDPFTCCPPPPRPIAVSLLQAGWLDCFPGLEKEVAAPACPGRSVNHTP